MYEPEDRLDPRVTFLWRISRMIRLTLFGTPMAALIFFGCWGFISWEAGIILAGIYVIHGLVMALIWPSLEYRYFRYAVREHDILVQQGVIFRQWTALPLHRIQHVDTRQGPIERLVGIANLQLYTAAGMNADGSIPGLDAEVAEKLRDELSRKGGDDGV